MDLEAKRAWDVALHALAGNQRRVDLEEDVVERGAEVGAVNTGVSRRLGIVGVLAPGAVKLHGLLIRNIGEPHGQEGVGIAEDARTFAEVGFLIFVELQAMLVFCKVTGSWAGGLTIFASPLVVTM